MGPYAKRMATGKVAIGLIESWEWLREVTLLAQG